MIQHTIFIIIVILIATFSRWQFILKRINRKVYYQDYLKSDAWRRKRFVVLKRDNWKCAYCGSKATEVHHKKYAKINIGKEPIEWLVSVCRKCHNNIHK